MSGRSGWRANSRALELQALSGFSPDHLRPLAPVLSRTFGAECRVRPGVLDAAFAHDARRGQYHSTAILQALAPLAAGTRLLAVTGCDLFVPILTFVFGEAQLNGSCAVVSVHRLREEVYGMPPNAALLEERLAKEAVHELGHTFGLQHCDDWRCAMASSHSVEAMDVKSAELCAACRRRVLEA